MKKINEMNGMEIRRRRSSRHLAETPYAKMVQACESKMPSRHPSDVIRYLRIGEGMTVEQVAEYLGVSMVTVRRWTPPDIVGLRHFTKKARKSTRKGLEAMWKAQRNGKKNNSFVARSY